MNPSAGVADRPPGRIIATLSCNSVCGSARGGSARSRFPWNGWRQTKRAQPRLRPLPEKAGLTAARPRSRQLAAGRRRGRRRGSGHRRRRHRGRRARADSFLLLHGLMPRAMPHHPLLRLALLHYMARRPAGRDIRLFRRRHRSGHRRRGRSSHRRRRGRFFRARREQHDDRPQQQRSYELNHGSLLG